MIEFVMALFNALAAIPKIIGYLNEFAAGVTMWYVNRANEETARRIVDAASLSARAKTQEERHKALDAWRDALSRKRYIK